MEVVSSQYLVVLTQVLITITLMQQKMMVAALQLFLVVQILLLITLILLQTLMMDLVSTHVLKVKHKLMSW